MDECNETYLAELVRHRNRKSSIKQMTPEELEVEEKFKRASKDELHDLIRSDAKVLAALAACVDRSMPAIKDQLEANRKKAQKSSVHTNIPAAPSCSNSSSQPAKTVAKASLDDAEEEEVRERENQILASLASRDSQTERGGKSNLIDRINLDNTNGSQILHDPGIENCCNSGVIAQLSRRNPTRLSPTEQLLYFQQALYKAISKIRSDIKEQFDTIQRLESEKRLLEVKADASILRRRRIIGMTITGASIHRELLDLVQPGVLLVEEAAEVSEPHLLACFGHRTEQLILIGDHKQLRPQTESYKLAKDYHLDVSMMERLIANGIKYDQLELQSRMKPELSILLRDIYPNLRDNLEVVSRDLQPRCFTVPTFFWTHRELESTSGGHGATNMEEAQRCVRLAMFLILQGCDPDRITILSAYRRQTGLIRNLFKDFLAKSDFLRILIQHRSKRNCEDLELTESPTEQSNTVVTEADLSVKIFTIDLYQGDENDIVIVSLVRSNPSNNIGFLKTLNRRCVAQSRARLVMVFIGNADCIYDSPNGKVWRPLIDAMKGSNCIGSKISLRCPNHAQSVVQSESFDQIPTMSPFCLEVCGIQMSCGIHSCLLPCQPPHDQEHDNCKVVVPFVHPLCNHNDTKFCSEPIGVKTCKTKVSMKFTECSHEILKECGMPDSFYKCHEKCERLLNCGHKCLLKCFELCSSRPCKEKVPHRFPCGHTINTQCCENRDVMTCQQPCSRKLPCNHPCTLKCGEDCKLKPCFVQTTVKYPNCEHSIKVPCCMSDQQFVCDAKCERKLACGHSCPGTCSADCASIACQVKIKLILPCAHPAEIECSIPESQVKCKKICNKQLEGCGHKCLLQCYQPCNSEKCKVCASIQSEIEKKQLLELQQAIRRNAFEELKKIRAMKDLPSSVKTISCDGDYCDEYLDVHDRVMKFIQSEHGWHPAITKIEKIENSKLTLQFLDFKAKCAADPRRSEKKFHGTSANALHSIVTDGFKLPSKAGMYGPGIYFATNSSKSSQQIYTKGSNMLLLCEVLIGRTLKVTSATQMYKSHADLKKIGYDSLFAPRNTKSTGGVLFDEYVIFDPRQAVPQYVIHYSNLAELPVMSLPPSAENHVLKIRPDRYKTDSDSCKALHFASVQSEYLRIDGTIKSLGSITEVWVNRNAQLEQKFKAKQEEFRNKYNSDCWVYAFHGTNRNSADQIFKENFRLDKCTRQAYGRGIYFSEFTHISKDYGDALLLCRVLPGREVDYPPPPNKPAEYDCVRVRDSSSDYSNMLVISNPDQILPVYRVFTTIKFTQ
ncbi:hypothetical protein BOX15_Mlig016543g4 [Macrostomum lignano]|uniref:Poly [ADP-ribose] polymerase n=1 Tax=Macrostomum lignano TaxID=282301 RepID=A0A267DAV8_9PLAT|nr:hypothetical protein BOX15_Mlig016543g4 [Macrostomum lignano]